MDDIDFSSFDTYLLDKNGLIIHQVWFDNIIPSKTKTRKTFESLKKYRDSWLLKNPNWTYICWNKDKCKDLIKYHYPQHKDMYDRYPYPIQRCDAVRYFILHRYGGLYADMDYYCNRPWDEVLKEYPYGLYLVETPNKLYNNLHVSNSLMYSKPNHVFWSVLFIELENSKETPLYYSKHMTIMFSTGPGILNRIFTQYKLRYFLQYYPYEKFHPYGINSDIILLSNDKEVFAVHAGKGTWETNDSKIMIFFYQEYKIILIIILTLLLPSIIHHFIYNLGSKNTKNTNK